MTSKIMQDLVIDLQGQSSMLAKQGAQVSADSMLLDLISVTVMLSDSLTISDTSLSIRVRQKVTRTPDSDIIETSHPL